MTEVAADPALEREGFAGSRHHIRHLDVKHHFPVQPFQQSVHLRQCIACATPARAFREIADRFVRRSQRGRTQEQARRETLDGAADDAMAVLRLDLAIDIDAKLGQRAGGAEHVGDVAERVLVRGEPRIRRQVDPPAYDVLAVVVARSQP